MICIIPVGHLQHCSSLHRTTTCILFYCKYSNREYRMAEIIDNEKSPVRKLANKEISKYIDK